MIPQLGQFAAILALVLSVVQAAMSLIGASKNRPVWIAAGTLAARLQSLAVLLAFVCLAAAFVGNDFTVVNVAMNSHSRLPIPYRIAATWGSHEGSLLLWTLMLSFWGTAVTWFARQVPPSILGRVVGVLGGLNAGFLSFMLGTSNPFVRAFPAPAEGLDLNPALQDAAMVMHPPLLYMGYVGFSVAFAFAVAALLAGRLDATWARWSRPWTTMAWTFLTCGIALGSYWAYYELGWGGWWFWDPVENASFMPWLAGTALMHSLAVTDKRGAFRSWTVLLAIAAFSLSLLGAFLVRSGVLTSVHAFATDPARGVFLLGFLGLAIGGSLWLYARRAKRTIVSGHFDVVSRESLLLVNNVFLSVAAASVLLGTLYPLFIDVLGKGKMSVGPPYFNTVFVAIMAPAMFLVGLGPLARWRRASVPDLARRLRWAFAASVAAALLIPFMAGGFKPLVALGLMIGLWIVLTVVVGIAESARRAGGWRPFIGAQSAPRRGYYGMQLAHVGLAVSIVGITMVTGYQDDQDLRMSIGDRANVGGYAFTFKGIHEARGANYFAAEAAIEVAGKDAAVVGTLAPQKRIYMASQNAMTETAIDSNLLRDLYVSLGEPLGDGAWLVQIRYKPFVVWIWGGAILMALGGVLAVSDPRYRRAKAA